ncbi:MAG: carboxypeptidase-like regulatory domain-containing protein [Planctomycetota bacterium]
MGSPAPVPTAPLPTAELAPLDQDLDQVRIEWVGRSPERADVSLRLVETEGGFREHSLRVPAGGAAALPKDWGAYRVEEANVGGWETDQHEFDLGREVDGTHVIHVRPPTAHVLRVRDADGASVAGVLAKRGHDLFDLSRSPLPSSYIDDEEVEGGEDGTVVLPRTIHPKFWWLMAPGYAWHGVEASPDVAEQAIQLVRGGDVNVTVAHEQPLPSGSVRASPVDLDEDEPWPWRVAELVAPGSYRVRGLAAGRWLVHVGPPNDTKAASPWAAEEVDVSAGSTASIALRVEARHRPRQLQLELLLHLPKEWDVEPQIEVEGASESNQGIKLPAQHPASLTDVTWRYVWPDVAAGLYSVRLREPDQTWWIEAHRGPAHAEIHVPAPRTLLVEVRDAATGEPIADADLLADLEIDRPFDAVGGWGRAGGFERTGVVGTYADRLPLGKMGVEVTATGYAPWTQDIELAPGEGPMRMEARLERGAQITVRLREGDGPATLREYVLEWDDTDDPERGSTTWFDGTAYTFETLVAGTYRITVRREHEASGAAPTGKRTWSRRVTLAPGDHKKLDIDISK